MVLTDIDSDPCLVPQCRHAHVSILVDVPRQRPVEHPADTSVTSDRAQISISSQDTPESRADIPSQRPKRKAT